MGSVSSSVLLLLVSLLDGLQGGGLRGGKSSNSTISQQQPLKLLLPAGMSAPSAETRSDHSPLGHLLLSWHRDSCWHPLKLIENHEMIESLAPDCSGSSDFALILPPPSAPVGIGKF